MKTWVEFQHEDGHPVLVDADEVAVVFTEDGGVAFGGEPRRNVHLNTRQGLTIKLLNTYEQVIKKLGAAEAAAERLEP